MNPNSPLIVLMYHGIISKTSDVPEGRETGAELYDVSLERFQEQIGFLRSHIFPVITVEDAQMPAGKAKIILTFDDGEMNNIKNALPVLQKFGLPAYFFVTTNRIGKKGYMGWEELKELRDCDMLIGSHGLTHQILTDLKPRALQEELVNSKEILERQLKINVDCFSVPRGVYNGNVIEAAKAAGYKAIFVSETQGVLEESCFARVAVKNNWPLARFERALIGQTPVEEQVGTATKGLLKRILGAVGYDRLRDSLLKKKNKTR